MKITVMRLQNSELISAPTGYHFEELYKTKISMEGEEIKLGQCLFFQLTKYSCSN